MSALTSQWVIGAITLLAAAITTYVALRVGKATAEMRFELAQLELRIAERIATARLDDAEARREDMDRVREWINGSFLRAPVIEAKLHEQTNRLVNLEKHISSLRASKALA